MNSVLIFHLGGHSEIGNMQDYVATRWYRAPELCGSFFSKVMANLIMCFFCGN